MHLSTLLALSVLAASAEDRTGTGLPSINPSELIQGLLGGSRPPSPPSGPVQVPEPTADTRYGARITIGNGGENQRRLDSLREDVLAACRNVHRTLYAMQNYWDEAFQYTGGRGAVSRVLRENRDFYTRNMQSRLAACTNGSIQLRLVGPCRTEQGTLAYVRTPFGVVMPTINVCDEYFAQGAEARAHTIAHEFGRLQGIGDAAQFNTDSIAVWDRIIELYSDDGLQRGVRRIREESRDTPRKEE